MLPLSNVCDDILKVFVEADLLALSARTVAEQLAPKYKRMAVHVGLQRLVELNMLGTLDMVIVGEFDLYRLTPKGYNHYQETHKETV